MKLKKLIKEKEFMIKSSIAIVLFAILILSFFFSSKIENALGLSVNHFSNQVSSEDFISPYFVEYIDVGQGNSTFVILPDGKTILIDGGNVPYGKTVCDKIRSKGVDTIDYLIATHADADHIGGLLNVLDEFEVKNIFRPFQIAGSGTTAETFVPIEQEDLAEFYYFMIQETNNKSKISRVSSGVYNSFIEKIYSETYTAQGEVVQSAVCVFYDGLIISGDDYSLDFFAPEKRTEMYNLKLYSNTYGFATVGYGANDSNGNSAILLLEVLGDKYLFTGDASCSSGSSSASKHYEELDFVENLTEDEKLLLSNVSVYLVGHHGSKYSSSEKLLSLIKPKFSVISVGKDNSYGHPSVEALSRLESVRTDDDYLLLTSSYGTITFGNVSGKVAYTLENFDEKEKLVISWILLGSVCYCFAVYLIFSIKPRRKNQI